MTSPTPPARRQLSPENARKYLAEGKVTQKGATIYVMQDTLSAYPPVKNEDLAGEDFVIIRLVGERSSEFGPVWIFEIGGTPAQASNSWVVGIPQGTPNDSVVGKNIRAHFDRNGKDALPLWVSMVHVTPERGQAYYCLRAPKALVERAEEGLEPPTPAPQQTDLTDLPF